MKGKALRRALETKDAIRIGADLPLIVDTTELITPEVAQEMLHSNKNNRPINWKKVEEYADKMADGKWELHAQGIIIDSNGNLLTGQKRLWAVVYSGARVYMRVSRGNPPESARLIDRGVPQSARDLASRDTERKHSPTEASIARAICVLKGNPRPTPDVLADTIGHYSEMFGAILAEMTRTKKTKSVLMILAAVCVATNDVEEAKACCARTERLAERLEEALAPQAAHQCWNRGAAFGLAMGIARKVVEQAMNIKTASDLNSRRRT